MGELFLHGEEWDPVPCANCECNNGSSHCSLKTCPICKGKANAAPKGNQCCGTCDGKPVEPTEKDFCSWRGKTYHDGDKFTLNPCTDCICNGGISHCVIRSCPPLDCKDYVFVETECCPVCQKKGHTEEFSVLIV
ncbi:Cysteine-rich motor neuron 1 protein [Apostichopus japonicus]|uniref:Cysteine-rich motor neuron 1 protein n=1 Tax=Stichopus japonicus TaxID=307972 RepID=A0A2G8KTG3_STIJA|nr:Cysteine-rich motor neuron 1 protein [Apostichopus japonicus]